MSQYWRVLHLHTDNGMLSWAFRQDKIHNEILEFVAHRSLNGNRSDAVRVYYSGWNNVSSDQGLDPNRLEGKLDVRDAWALALLLNRHGARPLRQPSGTSVVLPNDGSAFYREEDLTPLSEVSAKLQYQIRSHPLGQKVTHVVGYDVSLNRKPAWLVSPHQVYYSSEDNRLAFFVREPVPFRFEEDEPRE